MIKNKKASHVGMMLSFVIFITFIVFLFSILGNKTEVPKDQESFLDYLETEILNELYTNLTTMRVLVPDSSENCISIDLDSLGFKKANAIVKGESTTTSINNKILFIPWDGSSQVFDIFISDSFNPTSDTKDNCYTISSTEHNDNIQFIRTDKYIYEKNLEDFYNRYTNNPEQLKQDLGISSGMEFGFVFRNITKGELYASNNQETTDNVYSREISMRYFDDSAEIKSGFINFRIW